MGKDIKLKLASVGQATVQTVRPRVILAPLQLGLAVQMHHHFSSKFHIDSINSHGFCASYKTVQKYERSAVVAQGTEIPGYTPGHFVQYSTDNLDHNLRSLDGTGTFHGMEIIAAITPGTKATIPIPIRKVSAEDIAKVGRIEIRLFIGPLENTPLTKVKEGLPTSDCPTSHLSIPTSHFRLPSQTLNLDFILDTDSTCISDKNIFKTKTFTAWFFSYKPEKVKSRISLTSFDVAMTMNFDATGSPFVHC